jgi:serine/threonine protein kinase
MIPCPTDLVNGPGLPTSEADALVERLAEEMDRRWRSGERPLAEDYLDRHPDLWHQPGAAVELIYEEISLRREYGEEAPLSLFLRRFPPWEQQLLVLLGCHQLLGPAPAAPRFPAAGDRLGEFLLVAELGRGGHGRVFLATQASLADRPVVLKVAARGGREHLSLARLQHTHIVPLYSAPEYPDRNLRGLCLPYFGGAPLDRLLAALRPCPPHRRRGEHLLRALRRAQAAAPVPLPVGGPACRFLARASYPQAVCWVGACLADALQYAQERGLVHLDVKPSNVLLAADGQPILLDFHLARAGLPAGTPAPACLGGTPGYMAPEQSMALAAVRAGRTVPVAVDGRADVYALGLLLYEMLGGPVPPPARAAGGCLRRRNPQVSVGLAAVLARCLAPDPGQRYPQAAALANDLRRHLADQPLQGVANRSPAERWRKWRRRRPCALIVAGLLLAVLLGGAWARVHVLQQADKARAALEEGRVCLKQGRHGEARGTLQRSLGRVWSDRFARAEWAQAAQELYLFVERGKGARPGRAPPPFSEKITARLKENGFVPWNTHSDESVWVSEGD